MTQIICVLTPTNVLMASDRLLTWGDGPRRGQVAKDEECKLVSLGNVACIGYTGLARMGGRPTHEWIAKKLAEARTVSPATVAATLSDAAPAAFGRVSPNMRSLTFLMAGWWWFAEPPIFRPFFEVISNAYEADWSAALAEPTTTFRSRLGHVGTKSDSVAIRTVGSRLTPERMTALHRKLRRFSKHGVSPTRMLRLLVDEVSHTSTTQLPRLVGDKILAMSIPRAAADTQLRSGHGMVMADEANDQTATFGYFDPERDEFQQFGPTFILGDMAHTGTETRDDPANQFQSVKFTILHVPARPGSSAGK